MSYFTRTSGFNIVMYTDKSKDNFKIVTDMLHDAFKDDTRQVGILYNDRDPDMKLVNTLHSIHSEMILYYIASMKKTIALDDKLLFCQRTNNLPFVPQYIKNIDEISDISDDGLYFKR